MPRITDFYPLELEAFVQLVQRVLCDYHKDDHPFGLAYLYSQTSDNADSCFLKAIQLANQGVVESIGIAEGSLGHGYDGFDASCKRLKELGWNNKVPIIKIDVGGNVNTGSEAQKLVEYLVESEGYKRDLAVIAPPPHILRAFMTTVTACENNHLFVKAYAISGIPLSWAEQVRHSQGTLVRTRAGLLETELQRLEKYRAPEFGGMLSASQVLAYLDWRDSH